MNLLGSFDPGDASNGIVLIILLQTSVVISLAALWSGTLLGRRAEARHALWFGVLLLVTSSPAVAIATRHSGLAVWAIVLPVNSEWASQALEDARPRPERSRSDSLRLAAESLTVSVPAEPEPPAAAAAVVPGKLARAELLPAAKPEFIRGRSPLVGGLTLLWAVGVFVGLVRISFGWARTSALRRSASVLDLTCWGRTLERVRDALDIAELPPVFTSRAIQGPVVVGLLRPRVVLPEGLAESLASDPLRDVLIHECAHIIRRDAWVGLLQRLASAFFWPHPLVHYASGQLSRAREEVCDNHVLRCSDRREYARTLLGLTERYLPLGAVRPGLGLLGVRWTLADRVAGLLDARRSSMTRNTLRLKIAVWVLLIGTGLAAASVRLERSAQAEGPQAKAAEPLASAVPAVWSVEGTVVDEQGRPVAGAIVRAVVRERVEHGTKTSANGVFTLSLGGRHAYIRGVIAESERGSQLGLFQFKSGLWFGEKVPVKVILKPSRQVRVHVNDVAGLPVPGAAVEAINGDFVRTGVTTGPDGTAVLRVAVDAKAMAVIGLKAGAGFDCFENYTTWPFVADFPPLPADVTLALDGAQSVRVMAVDSKGEPVSGIEIGIGPMRTRKIGKVRRANLNLSESTKATTDRGGVATFDWLPKSEVGAFRFRIATGGSYSTQSLPDYELGGPAEVTAHLLLDTRLSGTVRFPDGRPAVGVLILAESGTRAGGRIRLAARTLADGSYVLDAPSESCYIVAAVDEIWAAPSLSDIIVREGRELGGLDLTLTKGTVLHGQVIEPSDHGPVAGAVVYLFEVGAPLPKELRGSHFRTAQLDRRSIADASGRYHFRVGPGRYTLLSLNAGGTKPLLVEVKNEAQIVRDLTLKGTRWTYFSGVVLEKTPKGERPVARAAVRRLQGGLNNTSSPSSADHEGRVEIWRVAGDLALYGVSPDRSLSRVMPLAAQADDVRLFISRRQ